MGSKQIAFGEAPNRSEGRCLTQIVSTTVSVAVSITLKVSLPALQQTTYLPSGAAARPLACRPVNTSAGTETCVQRKDGHRSLAGDVADRIDADRGASSRRARQIAAARTTTSPIADEELVLDQQHIVGSDSDLERPQHSTARRFDFVQAIRQIGADVQPRSVRRQGKPAGNFGFSPRRIGQRQCDHVGRDDSSVRVHREDPDKPVDVAEVDLFAVGREDQPRVTELPGFVRLENVGR